MNGRELLQVVGTVLARSGFRRKGGVLRRNGKEVSCVVQVQKDRWSDLHYIDIGLNFVSAERLSTELPLRVSDVTVRLDSVLPPAARVELLDVLDLGKAMEVDERRSRLARLSEDWVMPWVNTATTVVGICGMVRDGVLPAPLLTLVARRFLSKHCDWIPAEP